MLNTIIHDLPLGVALVLNVGEREQFVSRPLLSAPDTDETVTEHLLDGQQRLTALYRALRDHDGRNTYFLHFPELDDDPRNDDDAVAVRVEKRWTNASGTRFPMWADTPRECLRRGLVPVRLLDPARDEVAAWVEAATAHLEPGADVTEIAVFREMSTAVSTLRDRVKKLITEKRETVSHFNLPYLRLPASTSKHTALDVFVNMNTNAKPLTPYDIVVAELEGATGRRLKEMQAQLDADLPRLKHFLSLDNAVLQTSALLQSKQPNQRGYFDMDYALFVDNWSRVSRGLRRAIELVESLRIFDGERLPSAIPVPVIAALLADAPEDGDGRASVDRLMRRYAWRSFFTNRYEATAATRAFADHRGLAAILNGVGDVSGVPVFNDDLYALPGRRELMNAPWPRQKNSVSRAILAASNYFGARDFADDTVISADNVVRREYHHVFPNQLLAEAGVNSMLALNCVLITWKTNRTIGRLDPITYLKNRADAAPDPRDVRDRLDSHLVPYERLVDAGPYENQTDAEYREAVRRDFDAFLESRANLVYRFMVEVCQGTQPHLRDLLGSSAALMPLSSTEGKDARLA